MSERVLYRAAFLRGEPNRSARSAVFTAATEAAIDTGYGPEVLRMDGCDLGSYARNPVVLDTHRRESCRDVVGSAKAYVDGRELVAEITYLDDEDGQRMWGKVDAGAVRSVSIGYAVDPSSVTRVARGETREGVKGPALVVARWRLIEVSNVPVPADGDAVRREFFARAMKEATVTTKKKTRAKREDDDEDETADEDEGKTPPPADDSDEPAPADEDDESESDEDDERGDSDSVARDLLAEAESLGLTIDEIAQAVDRDPAVVKAIASGELSEVPDDLLDDLRQLVASKREAEEKEEDEREEEDDSMARAKRAFVRSAPPELRDLAEDVYLDTPRRSLTAVWADALAIAPSWAKRSAIAMIRANPRATLDEHRRALVALRNARMKPVGTPPPPNDEPNTTTTNQQRGDSQDFSGLFA